MREQFRIAKQNLRGNRMRTMLTTLGVVIGVASITLVLALGQGVREAIGGQVGHLGNNIVLVKPGQRNLKGMNAYNPYTTAVTTSLTENDYQKTKALSQVKDVAPLMMLAGSLKGDDVTINAPIIATSSALPQVLGLTLRSGQFLDEQTDHNAVVLGQQLALDLFGTDQAMGQTLVMKGRTHMVVGIVKNTNTPINLAGVNLDHAAYVSLDDGRDFNQGVVQIQQLAITAKDTSKLKDTVAAVDSVILKNHHDEHDFTTLAGGDIASYSNDFFATIIAITAIVSIVTLIVSGIGVMNILLVGVTERTREIGIRKALGATDQHILGQFLIESLIMCVTGGVIGLIVAYALAFLVGSQLYFSPSLNPFIPLIGFGLALVVGVVFGLFPALKAARKDPIEALRQYE